MKIERLNRLTDAEFTGLSTTDLFARLMSHKYKVVARNPELLEAFLNNLESSLENPWYFLRTPGVAAMSGVVYVSSQVDAKEVARLNENRDQNTPQPLHQ